MRAVLCLWKHAQCKHWTHFKTLLGKVLLCWRTEQVIVLVIAAAGIEGTSQSCSEFGGWAAEWLWVCTSWISVKILWWCYLYYIKSIVVLHQEKVDTGNKRKSCTVCPASFNILISPQTLVLPLLAVFPFGILSFRTTSDVLHWACYLIYNNINAIYNLNWSQGCVWFEGVPVRGRQGKGLGKGAQPVQRHTGYITCPTVLWTPLELTICKHCRHEEAAAGAGNVKAEP